MDRILENCIIHFMWFLSYSCYLYCGTPWKWLHEWPKHVGATNNKTYTAEQLHKRAFVGLCMNDKFTVMHGMEQIREFCFFFLINIACHVLSARISYKTFATQRLSHTRVEKAVESDRLYWSVKIMACVIWGRCGSHARTFSSQIWLNKAWNSR